LQELIPDQGDVALGSGSVVVWLFAVCYYTTTLAKLYVTLSVTCINTVTHFPLGIIVCIRKQ